MISKYYIIVYTQKSFNNNNNIAFVDFLVIVKKTTTIEHEIYRNTNTKHYNLKQSFLSPTICKAVQAHST